MTEASQSGEDLDSAFERAADRVTTWAGAGTLTSDQQLELYGLYKQALEGPCTSFRPSFFEIKARAKWAAWKNLNDTPRDEAKQRYEQLVRLLLPSDADEHANEPASAPLGLHVSTLRDTEPNAGEEGDLQSLHVAASEGDPQAVHRLLDGGADVGAADSEGCTALHWAADRGRDDVVKELLKRGADPNATDHDGQSPLHYAALCGHSRIIALLLASGANPLMRDDAGGRPADVALKDVAHLLEAHD